MTSIAEPARAPLGAERRFYLGMATAILLVILTGFGPSFYVRSYVTPYAPFLPMTPLVLLHGLLFTSWLLLFMVQVGLVSAGRVDLHRRLGIAGFAGVVALAVVGMLAALNAAVRHSGPPQVPPLTWLAVPMFDIPVFTGLIAAALYQRRNPQTHKRLMLSAMIGMSVPGIGRLPIPLPPPVVIYGWQILLLAALAIWDFRSRGRLHPATIVATVVLLGSWVFRFAIWQTKPWLAFAGWATSLL